MLNLQTQPFLVCAFIMCGQGVLSPTPQVFAQDRPEVQTQAMERLKKGIESFDNGNYGAAIVAFRESYAHYPTAIAKFNLAEAYIKQAEALSDLEKLELAEQALNVSVSDEPKVPLDDMRLNRIAELREAIARLRTEFQCTKQVTSYKEELAMWKAKREVCQVDASPRRFGLSGKVGAGLAGAGAVSLIVSSVYAIKASRQYDALQPPHTEGRARYDEDVEAFQKTQKIGRWTLYGGAGALVIGSTLAVLDAVSVETVYADSSCEDIMRRPAPRAPTCDGAQGLDSNAYVFPAPPDESKLSVGVGVNFFQTTLRF